MSALVSADDFVEFSTGLGYVAGIASFLLLRRRGFWHAYLGAIGIVILLQGVMNASLLNAPPLVFLWLLFHLLLFAAIRMAPLLVILPALYWLLARVAIWRSVRRTRAAR